MTVVTVAIVTMTGDSGYSDSDFSDSGYSDSDFSDSGW